MFESRPFASDAGFLFVLDFLEDFRDVSFDKLFDLDLFVLREGVEAGCWVAG